MATVRAAPACSRLYWPKCVSAYYQGAAVQVPQQLREPFLEAVRAGRIRSMQNKLMPAAPIHTPGALLLGDAFNMRHPLTGLPPSATCLGTCSLWFPRH